MKVKELISQLQKHDPELDVLIRTCIQEIDYDYEENAVIDCYETVSDVDVVCEKDYVCLEAGSFLCQ